VGLVAVEEGVVLVGQHQQHHLVKEMQAVEVADQLLIMVAAVVVGLAELVWQEQRLPEEMAGQGFKVRLTLHPLVVLVQVVLLAQDISLAAVELEPMLVELLEQVVMVVEVMVQTAVRRELMEQQIQAEAELLLVHPLTLLTEDKVAPALSSSRSINKRSHER
jgi:hypothetical protein